MSKVGKRILNIPQGVEVTILEQRNGQQVTIKGPLGSLVKSFSPIVTVKQQENTLVVTRKDDERNSKMLHGTTNSLLAGMLEGVSKGFVKELEIVGVGYNAKLVGQDIEFTLGFSHKIKHKPIKGVKIEVLTPTTLKVSGIDKQLVGQEASIIKKYKKPEPYGGKGIKYKGEHIRRKAGKAASK